MPVTSANFVMLCQKYDLFDSLTLWIEADFFFAKITQEHKANESYTLVQLNFFPPK